MSADGPKLLASVDVGAMVDGHDGDGVSDSIYEAEVAAAGAVQALELVAQGLTDSSWIFSE